MPEFIDARDRQRPRRQSGPWTRGATTTSPVYIQADAKSVYDLLFKPPEQRPPDDGEPDDAIRHEVGCWAHARRKFWEAAITKDVVAREALARIMRIFDLDRLLRKQPATEIKSLREIHLRPHTDAFFAWVDAEFDRVRDQRGLLRTALGYAHRQRGPLTRFYDDGRLRLDNNASDAARGIRAIMPRPGSCRVGAPTVRPRAASRLIEAA